MPADDDEYDNPRPRRRRRRDDDDDDDDRPRIEEDEDGNPISQSNGLAVASLVLGILSLCTFALSGIPAVILGILGLSKSKRIGGRGHGQAVAGIVLGSIGTLLTVLSVGLLLPAVQKVRSAASRSMASNNFRQVGLAVLSHNDLNNGIPSQVYDPASVKLPPGRGLSWRVGILPYLEQNNLFKSFNTTQAWDSASNRPFSDTIVPTYSDTDDPPGVPTTRIQAFVGPRTAFDPDAKWQIGTLPNGPANTILFVDADQLVPWARSQDIPYTPNGAIPKLGNPSRSVFLAGFADGSVRNMQKKMDPKTLHKLIMTDAGNPPPAQNWDD